MAHSDVALENQLVTRFLDYRYRTNTAQKAAIGLAYAENILKASPLLLDFVRGDNQGLWFRQALWNDKPEKRRFSQVQPYWMSVAEIVADYSLVNRHSLQQSRSNNDPATTFMMLQAMDEGRFSQWLGNLNRKECFVESPFSFATAYRALVYLRTESDPVEMREVELERLLRLPQKPVRGVSAVHGQLTA